MTLSMRSIILSSDVVHRMRWVTLMLSFILGLSFGSLPFFLGAPAPTRSRVVLREVATSSQSPMESGSDSSEVVGAMASNLAMAFMNFCLSLGRVRNNPVGDWAVSSLAVRIRSLRAAMMGVAPAGSSSSSSSSWVEGLEPPSGSVSQSEGMDDFKLKCPFTNGDDGDSGDSLLVRKLLLGAKADTDDSNDALVAATTMRVAKLNFIFELNATCRYYLVSL